MGASFPRTSVFSCGYIYLRDSLVMFLLLALIVQIVQVVHGGRDCRLEKYNADFGQDFYNLTNVDSLSQCQDTCESERRCFGFTWGDGDKTVQPTLVERGRAAGRRRGRPRTAEEQAAMTDLIAAGETTNTLATRAQGQTRRRGTGRGSGVSVDREPARNCALYGKNGMVDGVLRHGQESYKMDFIHSWNTRYQQQGGDWSGLFQLQSSVRLHGKRWIKQMLPCHAGCKVWVQACV